MLGPMQSHVKVFDAASCTAKVECCNAGESPKMPDQRPPLIRRGVTALQPSLLQRPLLDGKA